MEDDDGVPGRGAEDGEEQAIPGDPGIRDGPGGPGGPGRGGRGEGGAVPREAPEVTEALNAPRPEADAEPESMAGRQRRDIFRFILVVPFSSSMEAQIAFHLLAIDCEPHPGAVRQEVMVSGRLLAIRLTAEDIDQLKISASSCLRELSLMIHTMNHVLPPFFFVNTSTVNGD